MRYKLLAPCFFLSLLFAASGCGFDAFSDNLWRGSKYYDSPVMDSVRLYDLGSDVGYRLEYDIVTYTDIDDRWKPVEQKSSITAKTHVVKQLLPEYVKRTTRNYKLEFDRPIEEWKAHAEEIRIAAKLARGSQGVKLIRAPYTFRLRDGKSKIMPEKVWEIMYFRWLDVDYPDLASIPANPKASGESKPTTNAGMPTTSPAVPVGVEQPNAFALYHRPIGSGHVYIPAKATVLCGHGNILRKNLIFVPVSRTEKTICFKTVPLPVYGRTRDQPGSIPGKVLLTPGAVILDVITTPIQAGAWAAGLKTH
ncbi:MAG: hypothetical protein GY794_06240 [bacterium]|nr:hypothetical protein [bacterium]